MHTTTLIETLSHEGRGISKINGKTTFIDNALPDETVTFRYLKKYKTYDEGWADMILHPSSERVEPSCAHFLTCGGCSLQHMAKAQQITFKQAVLLEQLAHFAKLEPTTLLPPLLGPSYGYRRKARLSVRFVAKKDRVLVGFHEKNGRYVADIENCPILVPTLSRLIAPLKACLMTMAAYRDIPQIEVASGDEEDALIFRHQQPLIPSDQEKLIALGRSHGVQIYLQSGNLTTTRRILPDEGEDRLIYRFAQHDVSLKFHPHDFIQVNAFINERLVDQVLELLALKPADQVLDLFCGLGNFTLPIAKYCQQVTGVEGDQRMVDRAQENALFNQLTNTHFLAHDLTLPFVNSHFFVKHYDKILLDPPRSGAREILADLAQLKPQKIVYISCNPATLARDAGELVHQHGFRLESVGIMDMFPQTRHVESIAVFIKNLT